MQDTLKDGKKACADAVEAMKRKLAGIRTGRASLSLIEHIEVEAYDSTTPLNQLATLAVAEHAYRLVAALRRQGELRLTGTNVEFYRGRIADGNLSLPVGTRLPAGDKALESLIEGLLQRGDALVQRVLDHAHPEGSLSEQIDRNTGEMRGATDLTWSYAALISALLAREEAERNAT